jgi:hypothetical protein
VPSWFSFVFTYSGDNHALERFFNAIELVMETGFAVTAFLALILNLMEIEDEAIATTANTVDEQYDQQEWERIRRPSTIRAARKGAELEQARRASMSSMNPDIKGDHSVEKIDPITEV